MRKFNLMPQKNKAVFLDRDGVLNHEKKEDYIQCLQLYLDGIKDNEEWSKNYFAKRAFEWIKEKLLLLE